MTSRPFLAAIQRIEKNPLGRLMYGQRELFHSNLLAWFFDTLPDAADAVFLPLSGTGVGSERRVERERNNIDLVMHWPGRAPMVIENKVFSIPSALQLDGYARRASTWSDEAALVLLSISPPEFELAPWTYLGYDELAGRLIAAIPGHSSYEVETMRRYAELVRDLHELVSATDVRSLAEPVWLSSEMLAALNSSQMRAALKKARAFRVARAVNAAIDLTAPAKSGMTNSIPLVESLESVRTTGIDVHLGWQLQGSQLRRAAVYHDQSLAGRDSASREAREAMSRAHPEFFAFPAPASQERSGRKEFNHFAPNFVYQYVTASAMTVADLIEFARAVHADIRKIADPIE